MGTVPLLDELAIIAAVAVVTAVVLARLKLPTVAGLLLAGALAGPFGFGLVRSIHAIEVLAEVGVVLLLFTIGLEFSLSRLRVVFRQVAVGGLVQVGLTTAVTAGLCLALGLSGAEGVVYGFIFALSSTAIVLRALTERRELDAPHGRFIVGTLLFQDLCVVPMMLIIPVLGEGGHAGSALWLISLALLKAAAVVVGVVVVARVVVPKALALVDASRSREVFLLAILALCIGTAWLTSLAGLSLALGAFLGGMVVADTEYGHRAMGDMLPLRDAFVSVFFVSLGMLFDAQVLLARPVVALGLIVGFVVAKGLLATVAAMAMRFPARVAWLAGVGLAQFGEFGFVLARLAQKHQVLTEAEVAPVLGAGIVSMFLTPLLVRAAPHVTAGERLLRPLERLLGVRGIDEAPESSEPLSNHVVVIGFGVAGRFAARALEAAKERYVVLELNADNVRQGKADGLPVYYADATSEEALGHANVTSAKLLVLLMNDPQAAERIVTTVKRVAPEVPMLMRTRYLLERSRLVSLGANDVVAEEVEGAVEIIARMLRQLQTPRNVIEERLRDLRSNTQTTERKVTLPRASLREISALDELKIESVLVREGSQAAGSSALSLKLQTHTGALMVAVRRGPKLLERPAPTVQFEPGDVVYLVGTSEAVRRAVPLFELQPSLARPT